MSGSASWLSSLSVPSGLALWLAALTFILVFSAALVGHPPLRRAIVSLYVFVSAGLRYVAARLRGRRSGPAELRRSFETLGPTYIKLGQLIASSNGLFPDAYVKEFQKCLDRVPPEPWPVVERTLEAAYGRPLSEIFLSIERVPLASASIAQVYAAKIRDESGAEREVVIKVQRSGLRELVDADVGILSFWAELIDQLPRLRNANPRGIVRQFEQSIYEELDFRGEAARMDEWNRILAELGRNDVCAPRPYHHLCTESVLVMERLRGVRVDDVKTLLGRYTSEQAEARLIDGMVAWFQCMFRYGYFHGDVHAGNLLLLDDGRIAFLDFGIVGRLPRERRQQIGRYLFSFAQKDFVSLARVMAEMGVVKEKREESAWLAFAKDLETAYRPFLVQALSEIDYTEVLTNVIRISQRHGTRLPDEFILIIRQLLYFDRYARLLAPSLNLFKDPRLLLTIGAELAIL